MASVANYEEFKTYLAEFLWKDDDTVLIDNLDSLVTMATNELSRTLDLERRNTRVDLTVDENPLDITAATNSVSDFRALRSLIYDGLPLWPTDFQSVKKPNTYMQLGPYYFEANGIIYFQLAQSALPLADPVTMEYYADLPNLSGDSDTSYMLTDFLDLYTYAALKHAGLFIREDERIQTWDAMAAKAFNAAIEEEKHMKQWGAVPSTPRLRVWNP